jgi:dephospho-CoA kinase
MKIIGLTGGVAAGKNFVAKIFAENGAAIFDADAQVHQLFESDKLVIAEVKKNFPTSFVEQKIDRKILGKIVFADEKKLEILEKILHPKVRQKYAEFLSKAHQEKRSLVVLNIPLLLEKQGYECQKVVAVIAPKSVQKKRFLARVQKKSAPEKHSSEKYNSERQNLEKKFEQIHAKQMNNSQRKKLADFVINSAISEAETAIQVKKIIANLTKT